MEHCDCMTQLHCSQAVSGHTVAVRCLLACASAGTLQAQVNRSTPATCIALRITSGQLRSHSKLVLLQYLRQQPLIPLLHVHRL